MPKGISESFLRLLEGERLRAARGLVAAGLLALLGLALADLADPPRLGDDAQRYLVVLAVGIGVGVLWARAAGHRLLARLRDRWTGTMREAEAASSLGDLDRRLRGRGATPRARAPVVAVGFALANVVLFALLWTEHVRAPDAALAVLSADALAAGAWIGVAAYRATFARVFVREVDDLVARGTVGVWGQA